MSAIAALLGAQRAGATLECTQAAHDAYNEELAPVLARTVFQGNCGARYKDANGNVTGNSPWRLTDYFHRTRRIDPGHYTLGFAPNPTPQAQARL